MPKPDTLFNGGYDSHVDREFGVWLRARRLAKQMTNFDCANESGIPRRRWLSLERGSGKYGVTKRECVGISTALEVDLDKVLKKAVGEL